MIPSLVGGPVLAADFAPSIIFLVLYTFVVLASVAQIIRKRSAVAFLGTPGFAVERTVIFGLRLSVSISGPSDASIGLMSYWQLSFSIGFLIIATDLVHLHHWLLETATAGHLENGQQDRSRERFWYRRYTEVLHLLIIGALVIGIVSSTFYESKDLQTNPDIGLQLMLLRYISTSLGLFLLIIFLAALCATYAQVQHVDRIACLQLINCILLLICVCVYRLAVMNTYTDSLIPTQIDSWASSNSKTAFYLFHIFPEWLVLLFLLGGETRDTFGIYRWWCKDGGVARERQEREKEVRVIPNEKLLLEEVRWTNRLHFHCASRLAV